MVATDENSAAGATLPPEMAALLPGFLSKASSSRAVLACPERNEGKVISEWISRKRKDVEKSCLL